MSKVTDSQALKVHFAHHDVHGCLEILGNKCVHHVGSKQCLLDVDDEAALRDLLDLLPGLLVFDLVVFDRYLFDEFPEEVEADSDFSLGH